MGQEKLLKLFDFRELDMSPKLFALSYSEAAVDQMLDLVRERSLTIQAVPGPVERGDIVVLDVPAAGEQEAETLQLNVQKYFYDNDFEDSLVGRMPGDSLTLPARGNGRPCTLTQIKRRVLPVLTDELVAALELEDITTVAAYRQMVVDGFVEEDRAKKSDAIVTVATNHTLEKSQFGDLTEEIAEERAADEAQYHAMAKAYGMTYEEILARSIPAKYETAEQREEFLQSQAVKGAKLNLVFARYAEETGTVIDQAGYEAAKQTYLDRGASPEQIAQMFPFRAYWVETATNCFRNAVLDYYKDRFTVTAKP